MPTLTYPGVYVQEISSGVRPIEAASTSTAAFVGFAEMGPDNPKRVTNWTEFQRNFGGYLADSYLAHSVFQFFNNGGRQCYVVRVTRSDAVIADVTVQNRASSPVPGVTFSAKNKGDWGNYLFLQIEDGTLDPGNDFRISVRRQTNPDVIPPNFADITPLEVFDDLSMDANAPNYVVNVLKQNSALIDALVLAGNTSVQRGIHRGGFGPNLPLNDKLGFQINLDNDGFQEVVLPTAVGTSTNLSDVAAAIQTAVTGLTKKKNSTDSAAFTGFTCDVETAGGQSRLILQSGTTSAVSSVSIQPAATNDATGLLKLGSGNGGQSEGGGAVRRPASSDVIQIGDAAVAAPVTSRTLGSDGLTSVSETTFSNAFSLLDNLTDFSLLAVPDMPTTAMLDAGMAYCANRPLQDVFYIGEMLPN
ncbi:MAG TPA: hypothetical protein VFM05_04135, partial [Candidatus Saccharimonadales bacterium]|nr:hypothetical protein [Candidatus Saccharimonadales bacterium]